MSIYFLGLIVFVILLLLMTFTDLIKYKIIVRLINCTVIVSIVYFVVNRAFSVGSDYSSYHRYFYVGTEQLKSIGIEPLFRNLISIAYLFNNFKIVTAVTFLIFLFGVFIYSLSSRVLLTNTISLLYITYVMLSAINGIRQYMAIGVVFLGLGSWALLQDSAPKARWIVFVISIIIAMQIHYSSMIAFALPILAAFKVNYKRVLTVAMICSILYFSNLGSVLLNGLSVFFPTYMEKYGANASMMMEGGAKGLIAFIPIIIQFLFLAGIVKSNDSFNDKNRLLINGYLVYLFLFMGAGSSAALRIQAVFSPFLPVFYAKVFGNDTKGGFLLDDRTEKLIVLTFFTIYFIIKIYRNISGVVPYALLG